MAADPRDPSPDTVSSMAELVSVVLQRTLGVSPEDAAAAIADGRVQVHVSGDSEAYFARWNAWYDTLTDAQVDAYHHEETSFCEDGTCEQCALVATLQEP